MIFKDINFYIQGCFMMDRLKGLDLLRAIAILWVMLFHAWVAKLGLPFLAIAKFGWMGVDLFFALSGYLIGCELPCP